MNEHELRSLIRLLAGDERRKSRRRVGSYRAFEVSMPTIVP
jgi:hypothetical protein